MALPDKRKQMVLAHRVQLYIAHHHHLLGVRLEQRVVDQRTEILLVSAREELKRLRRPPGRIPKPLAIRIFPDMPYTAKAAEVGMGKGKGDPKGYQVQVWPGRLLFEIDGLTDEISREALRKAGAKLPVKTRIVSR